MKKTSTVIFTLLIAILFFCFTELLQTQAMVEEQEQKIEHIKKNRLEIELALNDKEEYISSLNHSIESLSSNIATLETKLQELSIASDKLD